MRKIKDFGAVITISLICICIAGRSVLAEEGEYNRGSRIASNGVFNYLNGTVVLDSADLTYLADEIDGLERAYKTSTMEALNKINTFYVSTDGGISHDSDDNNVSSDMAAELSFSDLYHGIIDSQSVDHLAGVQAADADGNPLYYADRDACESNNLITVTKGANDYPLLIHPAKAGNLTAGAAAWVDGNLIIGNGADNTAYYDNGRRDGYDQGKSEGYNQGKSEGYDSGYTTGYNEGFNQAKYKGNWEMVLKVYLCAYDEYIMTNEARYARVVIRCTNGSVSVVYDENTGLNGWLNLGSGSGQTRVHKVELESFTVK